MKKLFVIGAFTLALTSCKSGWTSAQKDQFKKDCVSQSQAQASMTAEKAKDYCDCMEPKVEAKYPKAEDAGKMTIDEATTMAKDCIK